MSILSKNKNNTDCERTALPGGRCYFPVAPCELFVPNGVIEIAPDNDWGSSYFCE